MLPAIPDDKRPLALLLLHTHQNQIGAVFDIIKLKVSMRAGLMLALAK